MTAEFAPSLASGKRFWHALMPCIPAFINEQHLSRWVNDPNCHHMLRSVFFGFRLSCKLCCQHLSACIPGCPEPA